MATYIFSKRNDMYPINQIHNFHPIISEDMHVKELSPRWFPSSDLCTSRTRRSRAPSKLGNTSLFRLSRSRDLSHSTEYSHSSKCLIETNLGRSRQSKLRSASSAPSYKVRSFPHKSLNLCLLYHLE